MHLPIQSNPMYVTPTYSLLTPHNSAELLQSFPHNVDSLPFAQTMSYTANGRIVSKKVETHTLIANVKKSLIYDNRYQYTNGGNRLYSVADHHSNDAEHRFYWDSCGNMTEWIMAEVGRRPQPRTHTWTEDNRLQTVADNSWFSYYQYDAAGDRTYKLTWSGSIQTVNGRRDVYYTPQSATLYASPYLVATPQGYTKHYYAESERITSQLGRGKFDGISTPVVSDSLVQAKLQAVTNKVRYPVTLTAPSASYFAYLDTLTNKHNATSTLYFYHSDHLGSSSWITTTNGSAVQHLHYLPFGEDFVNQKSSSFEGARYTFSAKEKDAETKYSYFGARYYSSELSIWLSVDPMSGVYPSTSPYAYCRNNPVVLIDPNGMFDTEARAIRMRKKAAKRYGEDRVSDVFNNTIDGGKANYAFSIYGEGKTKYSYGGGTNEQGGPVITCDKPDKVVFKRRDFRDYKESFTMAGYYREQISKSSGVDKFGYRLKLAGEKVHFDEQNFVDGAGPYLQGIVLAIPLVGVPNDIKTVFSGSDIYGNQSSTFSRVVSGIDALSLVGLSIKLFDVTLPKGFEKALNATNKTTTIYSVGSTINDQKSGTKKGGGDE